MPWNLTRAARSQATSGTRRAPARGALLVGCTRYDNNRRKSLRGPINDVGILGDLLVNEFGFDQSNVLKLTEGQAGAPRPVRQAIVREMNQLVRRSQAGDLVILYFAGHGFQQPGQPAGDAGADEPDGLDEVFLPADAGRWNGDPSVLPCAQAGVPLVAAGRKALPQGAACRVARMGIGGFQMPNAIRPPEGTGENGPRSAMETLRAATEQWEYSPMRFEINPSRACWLLTQAQHHPDQWLLLPRAAARFERFDQEARDPAAAATQIGGFAESIGRDPGAATMGGRRSIGWPLCGLAPIESAAVQRIIARRRGKRSIVNRGIASVHGPGHGHWLRRILAGANRVEGSANHVSPGRACPTRDARRMNNDRAGHCAP